MMRLGLTVLLAALLLTTASVGTASRDQVSTPTRAAAPTRSDGLADWQKIYSVMSDPRCINCHTASDYPQQADDRHRHLFDVVRGPEGKGAGRPGRRTVGSRRAVPPISYEQFMAATRKWVQAGMPWPQEARGTDENIQAHRQGSGKGSDRRSRNPSAVGIA